MMKFGSKLEKRHGEIQITVISLQFKKKGSEILKIK